MRAAVAAGADAVYFGCAAGFNARARASNFELRELSEVTAFAHARGVECYMCVNVLAYDEELLEAGRLIRRAYESGVDAIIVQDVGVAALARRVAPGLSVHASTQMSVTDGAGARFAEQLGCETVVVGRELSISEIARVAAEVRPETYIEAFVHGALCVSYSGQCLSSESWGGRSANRGQCAQQCRLPYAVMKDGVELKGFERSYALSPQDLAGVDKAVELIAAGVGTFKIEGRLKGEEYVYTTTSAYRHAIDAACAQLELEPRRRRAAVALPPPTRDELLQVFWHRPTRGRD